MCLLKRIRNRQAERQGWTCIYCEQPMWRSDPAAFAARHGLSLRQARLLQATAEHLRAKCDGGEDCETNIAAACVYSNRRRHHAPEALSSPAFAQKVRARLRQDRWHGIRLRRTD